jgi:two-component system, cell cycle sensor histidine kinase and response regulator CckA
MGTVARPLTEHTVLLVDDENSVRHIVGRMLTDAGFPVVEAASGDEAIAQINLLKGKVHLVVTDVAMPGMNGRVLAAKVAERWPALPVLLISGAAPNGDDPAQLRKPFTPDELIEAVERLLPF